MLVTEVKMNILKIKGFPQTTQLNPWCPQFHIKWSNSLLNIRNLLQFRLVRNNNSITRMSSLNADLITHPPTYIFIYSGELCNFSIIVDPTYLLISKHTNLVYDVGLVFHIWKFYLLTHVLKVRFPTVFHQVVAHCIFSLLRQRPLFGRKI